MDQLERVQLEKVQKPIISELTKEQQDEYEYYMKEARLRYPNTLTHILDLAIRNYVLYGDDAFEQSLSDEKLQEIKGKYDSDAAVIYGAVEIIRNEDIPAERRAQYEADNKKMEEALKNPEFTEEIKEKLYTVGVMSGVIKEEDK